MRSSVSWEKMERKREELRDWEGEYDLGFHCGTLGSLYR
jgi:hypothetical protein